VVADWEAVSKGAAAAVALVGAAAPLARPRARANLKSDLEILERFDPSDPSYVTIKGYIDEQVRRMYSVGGAWRRAMIFAGTTSLLGGGGLLIYGLVRGLSWWWYVVGGYLLLMGSMTLPQALVESVPHDPPSPESPRVRRRKLRA